MKSECTRALRKFRLGSTLLATAALLLSGLSQAQAQTTYIWLGSTNSTFGTNTNWVGGNVAPTGGSSNSRLDVNNAGNNPLYYTGTQGTTIYTTTGRSLVIGSGTRGSGSMFITGGTFDSRGVDPDVMGNSGHTGTLTIAGGSFTNVNGGSSDFIVGFGGNSAGILNVNSGSFTTGVLQFGATDTVSGPTGTVNLNGGILEVGNFREGLTDNVNVGGVSSTIFFDGGTLRARQNNTTFIGANDVDTARVQAGGAIIDTNGFNVTIAKALIAGTTPGGGLTKQGGGILTLTGTNTYTGVTTVSAGTLALASNLIANSSKISIAGGATLAHSAAANASFILASGQDIEGTGTGTATFNTGNGNFNGVMTTGDTVISHTGAGTLAFQRLEVRGTGNEMTGGNVTSGVANTRRGLLVGNVSNGTFTISGGTFTSNGGSQTDVIGTTGGTGTFIISGGNYVNTGTLSIGLGATNHPGGTMNINSGSATIGTLIYNSNTSGGQGIINLNGGTLTVGTLTSTAGATRQFNFNGGQFIASGNVIFDPTLDLYVQNGGANINTNGNTVTVDAALDDAGTGGLTKSGIGTLILNGANTYQGGTLVSGGTLIVNGALTQTSSVTVASGARLGGAGSITTTGNSTTIGTGGTLAPGDPIMSTGTGTLVLNTSSLTFGLGSFWEVNITGADHGRLQLNSPASSLDLSGVSLVAGTTSFDPLTNTPYWILDNLGDTDLLGIFANMSLDGFGASLFPEAPTGFVDLGGTPFAVFLGADFGGNNIFSGGNDILLFAIPEPSKAILLAFGLLGLLARRRR